MSVYIRSEGNARATLLLGKCPCAGKNEQSNELPLYHCVSSFCTHLSIFHPNKMHYQNSKTQSNQLKGGWVASEGSIMGWLCVMGECPEDQMGPYLAPATDMSPPIPCCTYFLFSILYVLKLVSLRVLLVQYMFHAAHKQIYKWQHGPLQQEGFSVPVLDS